MIPIPSGVRVWIATGHTDMRRGMRSLGLTVQESLKRDPHAGDIRWALRALDNGRRLTERGQDALGADAARIWANLGKIG